VTKIPKEGMKNTLPGAHHLLVYPDTATLRQVYSSYIDAALNGNNEVVIVFPFYETTDSARRPLNENEFVIDVKKQENQHSLVLIDSLKAYFGSSEKISSVIRRELERAKVTRKSGVSIFGDMGSFFYRHNGDFLDYKLSLSSGLDSKLKVFCLYHERDSDARLTAAQKQKLLEHHGRIALLFFAVIVVAIISLVIFGF
jgi:MEDS: MEthanogen/methylotroph, DcmR Sensory domain